MSNVLIIDDDKSTCKMLTRMIQKIGHKAYQAYTIAQGLEAASSNSYDVIFLDVQLPDGNGLNIIPKLKGSSYSPHVIIITGFGNPDGAEIAIKNGAWDYMQKPLSPKKLLPPLRSVLQYHEGLKNIPKPVVALKRDGIIGSSPAIKTCLDSVASAANSHANVLLTGETGTGKEVFAKAIHNNSIRANNNFVVVDCAALPETLVESSLFGYKKGAFTGANRDHTGLIRNAHNGTLFLDEVGELTLQLQKTFLRVVQERRFRPLGATMEEESNFRLLAATNRDLNQMVKEGTFRQDLLYRLRSITIDLPSLKQRPEDIKELLFYYMRKFCDNYQIQIKGFSPDFLEAICTYDWPGNVREFIHTLEKSIIDARHEPTLFHAHLPTHIRVQVARSSFNTDEYAENEDGIAPAITGASEITSIVQGSLTKEFPSYKNYRNTVLNAADKQYLQDLMKLTRGSINEACSISGLGRSRLYSLTKKYGISKSVKS